MTVQRIFSRNLRALLLRGVAASRDALARAAVTSFAAPRRRLPGRCAARCVGRSTPRGSDGSYMFRTRAPHGILRSGITTSGSKPMTGRTKCKKRMAVAGLAPQRFAAVVVLGASRSPRAGALLLRRCYSAARLAVLLRRRGGRTAAITLDGEVQADGDGTTPPAQTLPVTSGRVAGPVDGCRAQTITVSSQ